MNNFYHPVLAVNILNTKVTKLAVTKAEIEQALYDHGVTGIGR